MTEKIGIAIITCNRKDAFINCLRSLPKVDVIVVVNDGEAYDSATYYDESITNGRVVTEVIQHPRNMNVAVSKNDALRALLKHDCTHLFLCEDDVEILDPNVCYKYICAAAKSGIWHLNYALSGPANLKDGQPNPKNVIEYGDGVNVAFYDNCVGSWSYYHKGIIKLVGFLDERYCNAMEHVEHTYRIIQETLHPPYWWFADVADSQTLIKDTDAKLTASVIRGNGILWEHNFRHAMMLFMHKHKVLPTAVAKTSPELALEAIEYLHSSYGREDLAKYYGQIQQQPIT